MSESIFETFTDERGDVHVRVSRELQVLTREEADRITAEYKQMQTENAELLRELERMGNPYAKYDKLNAVIRRQRKQLTEVQDALERRNTENAKLRELVRAAWRCIHTGASCSDCRLIAEGCTLQTAMRELGVGE